MTKSAAPSSDGLVAWFQASSGAMAGDGTLATVGAEVAEWRDMAPLAGANNARVIQAARRPILRKGRLGIMEGDFTYLEWSGESKSSAMVLDVGTGSWAEILNNTGGTVLAVFASDESTDTRRVFYTQLNDQNQEAALSFAVNSAGCVNGLRHSKTEAHKIQITYARPSERARTGSLWWRGKGGSSAPEVGSRIIRAEGELLAPPVQTGFDQSLIAEKVAIAGTTKNSSVLRGAIVELLLYNKCLSEEELLAAEAYLYGRYFKK
jgi:hypothetical protein